MKDPIQQPGDSVPQPDLQCLPKLAVLTLVGTSFYDLNDRINLKTMGYLLIKKGDVKTFKSFLSGNEIEVGVRIGSHANIFRPDDEVYVFYDNDDVTDMYKARITRQKRLSENTSFLMVALVKDSQRSSN